MEIKCLVLELTNRCNLKCPMCMHTEHKHKLGPKRDLDLSLFKKINMEDVSYLDLCGNVSEPTCHPQFLEFVDTLAERTQIRLSTNGSTHTPEWWKELAKKLKSRRDCFVVFAIDGLEDTHSKYRIGSDFNRLIKNIEAFNTGGVSSFAQLILFKHNQHQVEDVKKLTREIGCEKLHIRTSHLYDSVFERPENKQTRHEACKTHKDMVVRCDNHLRMRSIFIDYEGDVFPCCFQSASKYGTIHEASNELYNKHKNEINLYNNSLDEILNGEYYTYLHANYKNIDRCQSFCRFEGIDFIKKV